MIFRRAARCGALIGVFFMCVAQRSDAQPDPSDRWLTIETPHFLVHFNPPLEEFARRSAVSAERAYDFLARELVPPRGKVELIVADNADYTNGYATPFPSNRIVIFAHPPVEDPALRNYEDWSSLVIAHELTHIFHLDRARGIWRFGRAILGRHASLFPNTFQPSWITEGLAVYYESRITGAGRLEGSDHYMIARAAAESGRFPRVSELSRVTTRMPGGETIYAYGGFIFDYLARTRGEKAIRDYIELSSKRILPLTLNGKSRMAFGISFDSAFHAWRDSLSRLATRPSAPMPGWKQLTNEGWYVGDPRWLSSSTLVYSTITGKEPTAAYEVTTSGKRTRIGRRNGLGANVPLSNGDLLFSQPEFTDPYRIRNDLYVQRGSRQIRLTEGARLSSPDVRSDGHIVAIQNIPASTRIVRVAPDGRVTGIIADGSVDLQWSDPRWNPRAPLIAAVRIPRGSVSEIVVLDTLGRILDARPFSRAIVGAPTWSSDGQRVYFTSDHTGVMQVYSFAPRGVADQLEQHSTASTGVFFPEPSPANSLIAALHYRFDGYHVGVAPVSVIAREKVDTVIAVVRRACTNCRAPDAGPGPAARSDAPKRPYSPWHSLAPKYWEPVIEAGTRSGTSVGIATNGNDVIGRHFYYTQATYNTKHHNGEGFVSYQYAGIKQPILGISAELDRQHSTIFSRPSGAAVGDLAERSRIVSATASFSRPRIRTFGSLAVGGEFEERTFASDPDTLLAHLPPIFRDRLTLSSVFATAGWTNTQRALLSISRENGVSLSALVRERWRGGGGSPSTSVTGVTAAYKALNLSGFAHHVIALRAAGGWADAHATSSFGVGGLSGGSFEIIGGFSVGEERRTFGVRGFPPSSERGNRAVAATLEYRAPIAAVSRRVPVLPVLLDRLAVAGFVEGGRAYCAVGDSKSVCPVATNNPTLASAGGELYLDTALQYDVPARFRVGVVAPIRGAEFAGAKKLSFYITFGSAF